MIIGRLNLEKVILSDLADQLARAREDSRTRHSVW